MPVDHLVGGGGDGLCQALFDEAEFEVGEGRSLLDHGDGADQGLRHVFLADPEIPARAFGLGAPIAVAGNFDLAERIGLDARGSWGLAV